MTEYVGSLEAQISSLRAEIERLRAALRAADVLRARWLNDGHELRGSTKNDFREAVDNYDQARAALAKAEKP